MSLIKTILAVTLPGTGMSSLLSMSRTPEVLIEDKDVTSIGTYVVMNEKTTTVYRVEKPLLVDDIVVTEPTPEHEQPDFYQIKHIKGVYAGYGDSKANTKTPELIYIVDEIALRRGTAEHAAAHEKYMDYIGIPF